MDFDAYRREVERLYHDYLKLWQEMGEQLPPFLPGRWRPHYERFELILDITSSEETLVSDIAELKDQVLARRAEFLSQLNASFRLAVITAPPVRKDDKKKEFKGIIERAQLALDIYRKSLNETQLSVARDFFKFDTREDTASKNAERKVRQYISHAKTLLTAAGNGTFFEALVTPLPKNK